MFPLRLATYFPVYSGGGGHSHTCISICEYLQSEELEIEMFVPGADRRGRRDFTREAIPPWARGVVFRLDSRGWLAGEALRRRYEHALHRAGAAYLWAGSPMGVYESAKRALLPVIAERINCHRSTAMRILDDAYERAGLRPNHGITAADAEAETRKMCLADLVFAPSPLVAKSLVDVGVPPQKIINSSYGWSPQRIVPSPVPKHCGRQPSFAFVGTGCIRKGTHLLLRYWHEAEVPGGLALYGHLTSEIREISARYLARDDVRALGHISNISEAYRSSDILVFPTLEEGSPLTVYEAMAHGLAIVTTPMGAGEVLRHGQEGIVLDAYDRDAWVATLRQLATDADLRTRLGSAAFARAQMYTWDKVGARRRAALLAALSAGQFISGNRRPDGSGPSPRSDSER